MILNFKDMGAPEREFIGGKVFLDGKEIRLVWYVDTERGIVKTYDIDGTRRIMRDDSGNRAKFITLTGRVAIERPQREVI